MVASPAPRVPGTPPARITRPATVGHWPPHRAQSLRIRSLFPRGVFHRSKEGRIPGVVRLLHYSAHALRWPPFQRPIARPGIMRLGLSARTGHPLVSRIQIAVTPELSFRCDIGFSTPYSSRRRFRSGGAGSLPRWSGSCRVAPQRPVSTSAAGSWRRPGAFRS